MLLASTLSGLLLSDERTPACGHLQEKRVHTRITDLVKALGTPSVTAAQARRLDTLGLGFQELLKLHKDISNPEEFLTNLKERGVRSKILREKLVKTLQQFK